ncbi:hypothetical protein MUP06_00950, partial [Patescibacteria group bacterium]|nr:hypothetical protein [Patescibacteria group bacterium]
ENSDWSYQQVQCTTTDPSLTLIASGTESFYLKQSWTYGELFIAFFIIGWTLTKLAMSVYNFLFTGIIRIKRKKE